MDKIDSRQLNGKNGLRQVDEQSNTYLDVGLGHELEIVSLQELRNEVLPCTFTNVWAKRFFLFSNSG